MRNKCLFLTLLFTAFSTVGCSSGSLYSNNSIQDHPCEILRNNYFSEYQAYKDARAANNGVEDEYVMSHYYASGEYAIQFSEANCENQGFSLDEDQTTVNSETVPESSEDKYFEPEITNEILNRLYENSDLGWNIDIANDLSGSNALGVILSDDGECGVWIFNDVTEILKAYDRGLFANSQTWYGTDSNTNFGIMLISSSPKNQCANDLAKTLNWDSLD